MEDTFKTARREHAAMEPEAALAYLDESGMLVVKSPLYHPFVQGQESIANTLALDVDKVRVICPAMGGNFGKRGDAQAPTVAGLLALKTGYPVRVVFSRSESLLGSSKTPSTIMTYKIGARKDGRVVALQATVHRNMGIWAPYLAGITTQGQELCRFESISATLSHITGPYEIPNVRATLYDVVANGPRSVPLRGTSGGYLPLAIESLLDRIAAELDIDPVEFRRRNALGVGSRTHLGQVMTDSVGIRAELDALREPYRQCLSRPRGKVNGTPWRRSRLRLAQHHLREHARHICGGRAVAQWASPRTCRIRRAGPGGNDGAGADRQRGIGPAHGGDRGHHRRHLSGPLPGPYVQFHHHAGYRQGSAERGRAEEWIGRNQAEFDKWVAAAQSAAN